MVTAHFKISDFLGSNFHFSPYATYFKVWIQRLTMNLLEKLAQWSSFKYRT